MKLIATFMVLLTLGSMATYGEVSKSNSQKRAVLKRAVRGILDNKFEDVFPVLESLVILNCKGNDNLQESYSDMKSCVGKKKIFVTPKEEYLSTMAECSSEAVKETKECLAEDKKYFPDLILSLAKSLAGFLYDDIDILRGSFTICAPKLLVPETQASYLKCLIDVSRQQNDTMEIPPKAKFCEDFTAINHCFTDLIKDNCDQSQELDKLREDYINAGKGPCGL